MKSKELLIDVQFIAIKAYENLIEKITKMHPSLSLNFEYLGVNKKVLDERNYIARKYIKITKAPLNKTNEK
jgi:hypothetical protein